MLEGIYKRARLTTGGSQRESALRWVQGGVGSSPRALVVPQGDALLPALFYLAPKPVMGKAKNTKSRNEAEMCRALSVRAWITYYRDGAT